MAGVNKVILVGNLGRDPEMRYTQSGTAVANLSVATTRRWRNRQTNEMVEETEWHRVSVWGQQAEHCNNYLSKGRQVYVEGRLQTREFADPQSGERRFTTEVVAQRLQMLGGRPERLGAEDGQADAGADIPF